VSTDVSEEHVASIFRVEKIISGRNQHESRWHAGFLLNLFFRPWRWRRNVSSKRPLTLNGLYGVISQKIVLFTTTAMRSSNPKHFCNIKAPYATNRTGWDASSRMKHSSNLNFNRRHGHKYLHVRSWYLCREVCVCYIAIGREYLAFLLRCLRVHFVTKGACLLRRCCLLFLSVRVGCRPWAILRRCQYLGSPLWSSGQSFWLHIQRSRVRFSALPHFLRSSGSGTRSTQPREDNWGATWRRK
jgi:hypothetical protein